jgi:hypothetical protein
MQAQPFDLKQVRLLDGPFQDAMQRNCRYLQSLDLDRLLHNFRLTAGLPSVAEPLGGWEAPTCELRGHCVGHYLSGCALLFSSTGDEAIKDNGEKLVAELATCQQALAKNGANPGYLSAFPESFIDRVEARERVWAPWYTLHKIYQGLLDMYLHCGTAQAMDVLMRMTDWARFRIDRLTEEQMQESLKTEFGGMNDVFANLYAVTGNPEHLRLARCFDHKTLFDSLARREDCLARMHANTQIPKAIGAARAYELTGEQRYEEITKFFYARVVHGRCLCTGGTSNYEWFGEHNRLAGSLSVESHENCCTYNLLKLTRQLFCWQPDVAYADYYERALLNGVLGTQEPKTGMFMYYVSMKPGHWKVFSKPLDSFWCCVGTGMESHAKFGDSIYFHDDQGLYVNLFIASELNWSERGVRIRQTTRFPDEPSTTLSFFTKEPVKMAVRIRVPGWTRNARLLINGKPHSSPTPGSYALIDRIWQSGDAVTLEMPMSHYLHRMPDDASLAALMYGPVALAGRLGTECFHEGLQFDPDERGQHQHHEIRIPAFVVNGHPIEDWVKPVPDQPLTFRTQNAARPQDVELVPFHKLFGERYSVYWRFLNEDGWQKAEEERLDLEARLVDRVMPMYYENENAHDFKSDKTSRGEIDTVGWRQADAGGWFSFTLAVDPKVPLLLRLRHRSSDANRYMEIHVDDHPLAASSFEGQGDDRFVYAEYNLPAERVNSKEKLTVKLQAGPQFPAPRIFEVAVMRRKA